MQITRETIYTDEFAALAPYLTAQTRSELVRAAQDIYGDFWGTTLDEFVALSEGQVPNFVNEDVPTVLQVYWMQGFKDFVQEYVLQLQRLQVPKSAQEQAAESGLIKVPMSEGLIVFTRNYFGLKSFEEAGKKTVLDYLIARRDVFNSAMFNKKLAEMRASKR